MRLHHHVNAVSGMHSVLYLFAFLHVIACATHRNSNSNLNSNANSHSLTHHHSHPLKRSTNENNNNNNDDDNVNENSSSNNNNNDEFVASSRDDCTTWDCLTNGGNSLAANGKKPRLEALVLQPTQDLQTLAIETQPSIECNVSADCDNPDKFCHDGRCICGKDKPIEDNKRCLKLLLIGEICSKSEQCLGNSHCVEGVCSCGDGLSIYNPSSKIHYCHPRRSLKESCSHDQQCPTNSYCSLDRFGCLCQNGYAPGVNQRECQPKICNNTSECESEFHHCNENKCMCLAIHFDVSSAQCHRYGSQGGATNGDDDDDDDTNNSSSNLFDDLAATNAWLIILLLILISLIILAVIGLLLRRHSKYCWSHTKEYEPNNKEPKVATFRGHTINKSFRRKKDPDDLDGYDQSHNTQHGGVHQQEPSSTHNEPIDILIKSPLMQSSTSTPV